MQLVAYGAQDVYLTGNPQITLFKVVYRRHTNFSSEIDEIPIDTARPGGKVSVQIQRTADLMSKAYHRITLSDLVPTNNFNGNVAFVRRLGHALIKTAEVTIGGTQIDKHYSVWLDIWFELTHTIDHESGYNKLIGDVDELTNLNQVNGNGQGQLLVYGRNIYSPLLFWFCRNYGLALPLIALQYHDVRINIEYEAISNLIVYTRGTNGVAPTFNNYSYSNSGLMIEYIYLDSEERRRFAQVGHEYLIEQLQYNEQTLAGNFSATSKNSTAQQFTLNFNHPCKELVFAHQCGAFNGQNGSYFLAYNNNNSELDWSNAIASASQSLANSVVQATNANGATSVTVGNGDDTATVTVGSSTWTVNYSGSSAITVYIQTQPILLSNYNLVQDLGDLNITFSANPISSSAIDPTKVSVVYSTPLAMGNLSIPINQSGNVDNRDPQYVFNDYYVIQPSNYGLNLDGSDNMVQQGKLTLNGHDRFDYQLGYYFNYLEPLARHTRTPADGINLYSFALHPEQHQPSGTCNFSRIDTARLLYNIWDTTFVKNLRDIGLDIYTGTIVWIFATNFNIFRMMAGMGGIAYSN